MTTIDSLPAAISASDTDEIPASQNGIVRKVTRAQLLAGYQQTLALPSGTLLGRYDPDTGAPESIAIGANLQLAGGVLGATATPFVIGALPPGRVPAPADAIALAQDGAETALSYAAFMQGVGNVANIPAGTMVAAATGTSLPRNISDWLADAVPVEAFGAVGDGVTDDTAALAAAIASGNPVRLAARTYIVNGQWTITGGTMVLIGVPGQSVLRRATQTGDGAWIAIQSTNFHADGVFFDANDALTTPDSWGVLVTPACVEATFTRCIFANASGGTMGSGLTFQAADPARTQHVVQSCEVFGNANHGIWVQALLGVQILDCRAHDNGGYGVVIDYADPTFVQKLHLCQVLGCEAWNNQRGVSVGNFNATNTNPPVWGNANPDAIAILIADNNCHDNTIYGIYASGQTLMVTGNLLTNNGTGVAAGAGIAANVSYTQVSGNMIAGAALFGIDAGGSIHSDVTGNVIDGAINGINPGGSQAMRITGNAVHNCTGWAILVNNVESDGSGRNFGLACANVEIADNWIGLSAPGSGGIYLRDAPQNVLVARNAFVGPSDLALPVCLWAHTDTVTIRDNTWNFQQRLICNPANVGGLQTIAFPDMIDGFMITAANASVQSMVGLHQQAVAGQITFVKVNTLGAGYTQASATIGGVGSGAAATPIISNGAIIGVAVTDPGGGYGAGGGTIGVSISGDGSGATATGYIGLPVPEERRIRIRCNVAVGFSRVGSVPFQENWTLAPITIPANAEIEWTGTWGTWRAGTVPLADYFGLPGDGSLTLRSVGGADLLLHPSGTGRVRLASDAEPTGVVSTIGHGSPLGAVAAPPGSDYRNLDGGAGGTFWIKLSGTDATGWVAVA